MTGLVAALGVYLFGAVACLAMVGRPAWSRVAGPGVAVLGCLLGIGPVAAALTGLPLPAVHRAWDMPFGSFWLELDALSAVFAGPILVISALAAVFGAGYLGPHEGRRDLAGSWFFFHLLSGAMLLVVLARNAMVFLLAWEIMSLASFFLVMADRGKEPVRRAGWTYLVATHLGTAFLLALFVLLGRGAGTLDFAGFSPGGEAGAGVAFVLAVIGFGTKAGFVPLHVWLPEAHPAAPSHVSAVMSGVMIKTGLYGVLRTLTFLGAPPPWWGWTLIGLGAASGILGVLFALGQRDLKRLLAYSSVENIGIIAIGIGLGLLGVSYGRPALAGLGFAGGLLHVVNHAVFKSLLFLGAGSVLHAAGTLEIDRLGGLQKRMPVTALAFLAGSVAICGLPPLNGFVSEFLLYLGALSPLSDVRGLPGAGAGAVGLAIAALALIGGLAAACFTRAFGMIFLGEPRDHELRPVHESAPAMWVPVAILAAACLAIGLAGPWAFGLVVPAAASLAEGADIGLAGAAGALRVTAIASGAILLLAGALAFGRSRLLANRPVAEAGTWDCGYAAPTARMQYTASSFADPIIRLFRALLRPRERSIPPDGFFPGPSSFASEIPDLFHERVYRPLFLFMERLLARFRWLQHGRLNLYVLYIAVTLLALLAWKLKG